MIMKIEKCFLFFFILIPMQVWSIPEVQIRQDDVPFVIGLKARYEQNADLFEWIPFDSLRTWWDLTVYPSGRFARVNLLHPSQGIPPAPDTFPDAQIVELDTLGDNSPVWSYLSETQLYLYIQGIDLETGGYRFIGNYRPDYKCYSYPIYDGGGWNTAWTWTYYIDGWLPYTANETHQKTVVAKGKVKVPLSGNHFWPCLVIRDHMEFTDNFGTQDTRWIYEWVVPGRFGGANGVAAAQSTNGASQNFVIVENFLKINELYVPGWDVRGPEFANTTIWPDTNYAGPYIVQSTITDSTGIGADSLFYNVNGGQFTGVGHDSVVGDTYYFHIPEIAQTCTLGYFIWAEDSFCVANGVDLWHTDPICAPESTYYKFIASTGIDESKAEQITTKTNFRVYPTVSRNEFVISFNIPENFELKIYNVSGRLVKVLSQSIKTGNIGQLIWCGDDDFGNRLSAGVYFLQIRTRSFKKTVRVILIKE